MSQRFWLKMIGAADRPLADQWVKERPELLSGVRTTKVPRSIGRGDLLVYYSAGSQRLFAIARSTIEGEQAEMVLDRKEDRWPYVIPVQVLLLIPALPRAPDWRVLNMPSATVQQKSYVELSRPQYALAWEAIVERTRLKD